MANNRGKKFEEQIRQAFEKVPGVSVDRVYDQMSYYRGSKNICDFVVYKYPTLYYIECKSVCGNTLSIHSNDPDHMYGNITNAQWKGLLEKSKIPGVVAGVICWWIDHDTTVFLPIGLLQYLRDRGDKSVAYWGSWVPLDFELSGIPDWTYITGRKKVVYFDYDMIAFFSEVGYETGT